jgi:dTMP kinase
MKQGLFIAIDGLSGSGKDTQIWNIARNLYCRSLFEDVLVTREPWHSESGRRARKQREEDKKAGIDLRLHADLYAQLYAEDTVEHCRQEIIPARASGMHVVSNRYSRYTSPVYQPVQGASLEKVLALQRDAGIVVPDLAILFDIPAEVAHARIVAYREPSSMEKPEIMRELRKGFLALPQLYAGENVVVVNADRPKDVVFAEMEAHLDRAWEKKYQK